MDKFLAIVVPDERAAAQMVEALERLDCDGAIELFATAIATRESDGHVEVKARDDRTGLATLGMTGVGALVGLLAGPIGLAVGATAGAASGLVAESAYSGVTGEFLSSVAQTLAPGAYAVLAEADEFWSFSVDDAAKALGGRVIRQAIGDAVVAQMKAEEQAAREELDQLDSAIAQSTGKAKEDLEARRESLKAAHETHREQLKTRMQELERSLDAKVAAVQEKVRRGTEAARARHEEHARSFARFVEMQKESFRQLFA